MLGQSGRVAGVVTHPRLPQIRTCPIKAYGLSSHGLACRYATRWRFVYG